MMASIPRVTVLLLYSLFVFVVIRHNGDFMICTAQQNHSGDKIMNNEMGEACGTYAGEERCLNFWWGKAEGKSPLGEPGLRREDDIKMDLAHGLD
jgi:hypothetical protein